MAYHGEMFRCQEDPKLENGDFPGSRFNNRLVYANPMVDSFGPIQLNSGLFENFLVIISELKNHILLE